MNKKQISVADFGASPNKENNAEELRKAFDACRGRKGLILYIPPGIYHFRDPEAVEMREMVMAGKLGKSPERMMFFPYAPYVKGLDFSGCENLIVQAQGAVLMCEGWMEPVSLERCRNITLNGLTIDYHPKPFSIGKIVHREEKSYDVQIDLAYPITSEVPCTREMYWNVTQNHLVRGMGYHESKVIAPQMIRFLGSPPNEEGEILTWTTYTFHFRPAILIHEAENIVLDHVTIHAQPGMGIVGNRGHNITMSYLQIIPSQGLHFSTNTDATHFTSCTGDLIFDHCHIEGQGDDSTNIHCYYHTLVEILQKTTDTETVKIRVDAPTGTHAQVLDYFDVGDTLELVELETLKLVKTFKVSAIKKNPEEWYSEVTVQGHFPQDLKRYMLVDITRMPHTTIKNCHFCNNAGRVLIKTRNVLIENNLIENNLGAGIFIGAEAWWKEGTTGADIIVRNNTINNCGAGIIVVNSAKDGSVVGVNRRIQIENNTIKGPAQMTGISINNAAEIAIQNNQIKGCQPGIFVDNSQKIKVIKNNNCTIKIGEKVTELEQR